MAEVKVEIKGRVNLIFVLQAMHLDSEDVYDMPARHGPLTEFVTRSARALEQKGGGRLDLIFRCSCLKASAFLLSLSCSLFLVERRPISGAPATHQAPEHPCFWPCLAPGPAPLFGVSDRPWVFFNLVATIVAPARDGCQG